MRRHRPQLILVAGLLLEMIVTTRDQGFKARLKKLLKAVAKVSQPPTTHRKEGGQALRAAGRRTR